MANYFAHTATTSPTKVLDADSINREVFMQIIGNTTVYLGDNDQVTISNGFPIAKHEAPIRGLLGASQELWCIVEMGTESVRLFTTVD
jgi:hypothetical protein